MATLKISELSVGDWVLNHRGFPTKVQVITSEGNLLCGEIDAKSEHCTHLWVQDIKPIPITPEMLEKNGWFRLDFQCVLNIEDNQGTSHDGEYVIMWYADDEYLTISWGGRENDTLVEREMMECRVKYIHQLQHALRLASVDKEIVMPKK